MNVIELSKRAGWSLVRERAWQQVWLDKEFFCLVCDLTRLPPPPRAKVAAQMMPMELADFDGFLREFDQVSGADAVEVYARERLRLAGVRGAFAARDEAGAAMYTQWLVTPEHQAALHAFQPGRYRRLGEDEGLIEGAYTFTSSRGLGLMAACQHQLLARARDLGLKRVWTYVGVDNIPSLKGCAKTGFVPDHLRTNHRRFGAMRTEFEPLRPAVMSYWSQAA